MGAQDPLLCVTAASPHPDLGGGQSMALPIAADAEQWGHIAPRTVGFCWLTGGLCGRAGAVLCPYLMAHQEE